MADRFLGDDAVASPATDGQAVTPSDATPLTNLPKALYIGGAGDLAVRGVRGAADVTFKALPAGTILPFRATYVRATGTTATSIVALF